MIFLMASIISVLASFSLCTLSILTLSTISAVFKCQETPVINLKSALSEDFLERLGSKSVGAYITEILTTDAEPTQSFTQENTSFGSQSRCPIEPSVADQALIVSVRDLQFFRLLEVLVTFRNFICALV